VKTLAKEGFYGPIEPCMIEALVITILEQIEIVGLYSICGPRRGT
jgi:hypothetical protein